MSVKTFVANMHLKHMKSKLSPMMHTYPDDLLRPKHILVCLPGGLRELTIVKQFLPNITDLFKPADITLMSMPGAKVTDIFPRKGFQILAPTSDQITWTGLPKKSYLNSLSDYKFDAILDLSIQPSVFTSGLLLNFPSAIRIGRGNHLGRPFYNLEIKTKFLRDERNIYRSLLETIGLMRGNAAQASHGRR